MRHVDVCGCNKTAAVAPEDIAVYQSVDAQYHHPTKATINPVVARRATATT